jgi:5'-3' exoribonuclease 1
MGPSHKIPEEKMFLAIFAYIEHLYGTIKPKKLFFMAVDGTHLLCHRLTTGVAPRAKMNQQRGRRFRSAKDAEDARKKAAQKGEEIPDEPFDSNCITPGTVFMAELSKQLRYFINKKVSEDKDWQGVEIVLSGHEVVCLGMMLMLGSWGR